MEALPKAIIFDWDNTLVDTQYTLNFALKNTMQEMGYDVSKKNIVNEKPFFASREIYFRKAFEDRWQEASAIYNKYIRQAPSGKITLYDEVEKVLQLLLDNNIHAVIVSNKFGTNLREEVEQMQLSKYFSAVIGSGDTEKDKPSVIPAETALKYMDIKPDRNVWFIGDSITDMECARRLGVTKLLYGTNSMHNVIPDFYVQNHDAILDLMKTLSVKS